MAWVVEHHDLFDEEFEKLSLEVQDKLLEMEFLLTQEGHLLSRPFADHLEGSAYPNMKELRFKMQNGEWRFAFAFDPKRKAIILVGGDKTGINQKRFYEVLIRKADQRFKDHLEKKK